MSNWLSILYIQPPIPAPPAPLDGDLVEPTLTPVIPTAPTVQPSISDPCVAAVIVRLDSPTHVDNPTL